MNQYFSNLIRATKTGIYSLSAFVGTEKSKQKAIQELTALRGLPTKYAQIKASFLNEETAIWKDAVSKLPVIESREVLRIIEDNNPAFYSKINIDHDFNKFPASIGQVNCIMLKSSELLAVKIQYPNIKNQLNQDTGLLDMAGQMFYGFQEGLDFKSYQNFIQSALIEELDYSKELINQNIFRDYFLQNPHIIIPNTKKEFSSSTMLVQEWEDSIPIELYLKKASSQDLKKIANLFTEFYFTSVFYLGYVHTDPNLSNFGIKNINNEIALVVYDFGSVYKLSDDERFSLLLLIENQHELKYSNIELLTDLGFDSEMLLPIQSNLHAYLSVILEPFLGSYPFDLSKWKRNERCVDILGARRFQFMLAANPSVFPLMRALMGFFHWITRTTGTVWVAPILEKIFNDLNLELREYKQSLKLKVLNHIISADSDGHSSSMAKSLKIEVFKNQKITVQLEFHRNMIERLEEIMDPNILSKISDRGISIPEIIRKARRNSYKPMILFEWTEDESIEISELEISNNKDGEMDADSTNLLHFKVYLE